MEPCIVVLTNVPDRDTGLAIARALIDAHLAACVNVLSGCTSVYRWNGAVETADEVPVLIKTQAARYPAVEQAIRRLHPYELPEIVALPLQAGLPGYLEWIGAQTETGAAAERG